MNPKILVLAGDGINCERETAQAFQLAKGEPKIIHINDLLENPSQMENFQILALPGGFSFGDDLGSGQILALKMAKILAEDLRKFVDQKKPIIGICNGFQALTKLGLLPNPFSARQVSLARNTNGAFIDRWVDLEVEETSQCIWTKSLKVDNAKLALPIRHGEGRLVFVRGEEESIHRDLTAKGQVVLRYTHDVNGSYGRIAGICDPSGLIFGLMPHPEAAISTLLYPTKATKQGAIDDGLGLKFFHDAIKFVREK
ncbi:MAG: phosphoribosylformylglycinamidine synthase subunit PurQ [Oligoflexia bacterium]|nr:phosphoribosylformylglycinamidine synthase subunit PurQ [Oligoflexia bacterium]